MSAKQNRGNQGIIDFDFAIIVVILVGLVVFLYPMLRDPAFDDARQATSSAWQWIKQKVTSVKAEKKTSPGIDRQQIYEEERARWEARGKLIFDECVKRCEAQRPLVPMSDGKGGMINYAHDLCRDECERLLRR